MTSQNITIVYVTKRIIALVLKMLSSILSLLYQPKKYQLPPIQEKVLLTPALRLSDKIKAGELKCEQVVEIFINQIKRVNPIINAVVETRYDSALVQARQLDQRLEKARLGSSLDKSLLDLPLVGVPLTVKETVSLEGAPLTGGLPSRRARRAKENNGCVQNLIDAGLIPIASTNTPCMNAWWDSSNVLYGRTNNPYDLSRIPGGSSGGEAAIIASGGSLVGVGSDLAGSIRIPSNFCGIFGHKPTPFTVSNDNCVPAFKKEQEKMRGVGPMTRYACDLKPMLKIMAHRWELDKLRLDEPVDLKKISVYYCPDLGDPLVSSCDRCVSSGLAAAVEHLNSTCGVKIEKVTLDEFKYGISLWSAELEVKGGKLYAPESEDGLFKFNPLVELVKWLAGISEYPLGAIATAFLEKFGTKYGTRKHAHLTKKATDLRERFYNLVGDNGVLLMPTHPEPAPHHQTTLLKFLNVAYTALGNVLCSPITQVPLGMSREGLPFGLQVIAKPYNDRLTLAVACELEKAFGGWLPPSKVTV